MKAPIGSAEFLTECARINGISKGPDPPKPGTLGLLIAEYRASAAFVDLAPRTQADYHRCLDYLKPIADTALIRFDRPLVVRIRDKAAATRGRRFGNYVKAVLSIVFAWGTERGYLVANPAEGIKDIRRNRGAPESNRPWADEKRHNVLDAVPRHMKPALALMMFCGLGPKDALKLPCSFYRDGEISTRRSKTGEPIFWPAPAELRAILESAPKHNAITLCVNSNGKPWTESGFRASWRKERIKLEEAARVGSGLTLYGLRHTVAVILREAGYDERTLQTLLGRRQLKWRVTMPGEPICAPRCVVL